MRIATNWYGANVRKYVAWFGLQRLSRRQGALSQTTNYLAGAKEAFG